MSVPVIKVDSISKGYRIGRKEEAPDTLVGHLTSLVRSPFQAFNRLRGLNSVRAGDENEDVLWALKDVSFDVSEGEVVGIVGRNGAGKSTLLKILSRITEPTSGRVAIRGRVASLLEVGTGFHPELTGRENVYMNGTILGMRKRDIDRRFDEIVEFSGVEKFLDTPTKRYSSGMQVRLAFAVAAHLEPEILIIDEVLAVGDATYQRRCIKRMQEVAREGRTVLFVSHNLDIVPQFCNRGIYIELGKIHSDGPASEIVEVYLESLEKNGADLSNANRIGDGRARFVRVELKDDFGKNVSHHTTFENLVIRMEIESDSNLEDVAIAVNIATLSGTKICSAWTRESAYPINLKQGKNIVFCTYESLPLRPGHRFAVQLWAEKDSVLDSIPHAATFDVVAPESASQIVANRDQGCFVSTAKWKTANNAG